MTTKELYDDLSAKGYAAFKAYDAIKEPEDNCFNIIRDRKSLLLKASVTYFNMAFDVIAFEELVKE